MDIPVFPLFYEMGSPLEIVFCRVFHHHQSSRVEHSGIEHFLRNSVKPSYRVRGIREYNVEPLCTDSQKVKYIVPHHLHPL